jgi:hypothetical protein
MRILLIAVATAVVLAILIAHLTDTALFSGN